MAQSLDPAALISLLPTLLPQSDKLLKNPHDAITSLVHAAMSALAFRLTAVDDSSSSIYENNVFPVGWNKLGPGNYTLKYKHEQSSLEFVIKLSRMSSRMLINAIALETDKVVTLDIATEDFTSSSFYPCEVGSTNAQPLIYGFISSNRVTDLMSQLKLKILQKIIPGLRKEGYSEEGSETTSDTHPLAETQPSPSRPQALPPPEAPHRNPFQPPSLFPNNPLEIGRRDLDPFASDPFHPPSLFPSNRRGSDGMFVGPDHPIFGVPRSSGGMLPRGPWGGDGYLSPMGAPPGARFDPVGPELYPRRGGLPGRGRGSIGPTSGEPDNDEFMPPDASNMYL